MRIKVCIITLFIFAAVPAFAREPIGIFDDHLDVGEPTEWGFATYDDGAGRYTIEGPGETIGYETFEDEFHFAYKEMSGSFAIEGIPAPIEGGRGGVMIRQNLDADAVHGSFLMTSEEGTDFSAEAIYCVFPTFRTLKGGSTIRAGDPEPAGLHETHTGKIRLERIGNSVHYYTYDESGSKYYVQSEVVPLDDSVLAGLAVTAESGSGIAYFEFTEVAFEEFPLYVYRSIPAEEYEPGAQLTGISITARVREGETVDTSVHEVVPVGAVVSNVQADDGEFLVNDDGSIDWTLSGFSGEATLTYDLTLGTGSSGAWQGTFNDGINRESFLGGDTVLPKHPEFQGRGSIEVDPVLPTLFEAEWGTPVGSDDFGLFINPEIPSGIAVVAVDNFASDTAVEYALNIPKDGTYYFFGNVRSEDGNSDSFHTDVDYTPVGDDSSRWGISSRKEFNQEWLSSENPNRDPRPFELTAGEHVLIIACRERSASLDYLVVTTNPDLDPDEYTIGQKGFITRCIPETILEYGSDRFSVEVAAYAAKDVEGSILVTEIPPDGGTVENIAYSAGTAELSGDGNILWDITGVTGEEATLTYDVVVPSETWGGFSFDGEMAIGVDEPLGTGGDDMVFIAPPAKAPTGKTVYFFRRLGPSTAGDSAFNDEAFAAYVAAMFGVEVVSFDDTNAEGYEMPPDLSGADAAFVSGSIGSSNVGDMEYHLNSPVPIFNLEGALDDDYAFQPGEGLGSADDDEIEIVDNTHPITQGFPQGAVQVYDSETYIGGLENPPDGLRVLVTTPANPNLAALWGLEPGESANGVTTPGLRVDSWMSTSSLMNLNNEGLRLLNQIIAYVLDEEPPTAVEDFALY